MTCGHCFKPLEYGNCTSPKCNSFTWTRINFIKCDLCNRIATWQHNSGGYRCSKCSKPKNKKGKQ